MKKPHLTSHSTVQRMKVFPLRSGKETWISIHISIHISIQHCTGSASQSNRQEKETKDIQTGKEVK